MTRTPDRRNFVLTRAQREAVFALYSRNPDGSSSYRQFRKRVLPMFLGDGAACIHDYARMFVGIETCGYTHT